MSRDAAPPPRRSAPCRIFPLIVLAFAHIFWAAANVSAAQKTIGVIMTGSIPYYKQIHENFTQSLAAEGLGSGSVDVILQSPTPEPMSWTNAARKLVAMGSDVIVAYGAPAALTALDEASDIPIIFAGVFDPRALGITGKNATGISSKVPMSSIIGEFKKIVNFSTLGVVFNEAEKDSVLQADEVSRLEDRYGFHSTRFNIRRASDASRIAKVDALLLTGCAAVRCVDNIIAIARREKIPAAAAIGGGEISGVILTIVADPEEQGREAAEMAAKVIRGAKPSSLSVRQPRKVEIIINLNEAADMGLKVPFDLLHTATKIIE